MKKLRLITLLIAVLFLGTRCQALDSAKATFFGKHVCVSAGAHASRCKINAGDTLSKDSLAVYGDLHLYSTIKDANPNIVNVNTIYANAWIIIAETTSTSTTINAAPDAQPNATETAEKMLDSMKRSTAAIVATAETVNATIDSLPIPADDVTFNYPLATPTITTTAKIAGYKLAIPKEVMAATGGVPLGVPLTTHYYLYRSDNGRPREYVRLKGKSFARQEGDTIVIYVPLKQLPTQPWSLDISGLTGLVDGKLFVANAQVVQGKLPGPHHTVRTLFSAIALGGSGYTLTAAFGPIAGPGVVAGILATRAILHHSANAAVERAERNYNLVLATQSTLAAQPTKEAGQ